MFDETAQVSLVLTDHIESLDAEPVKRGCTIQKYRMLPDNFFQYVPDFRTHTFHHSFRAFDVMCMTGIDQFFHYERFEKFKSHFLR